MKLKFEHWIETTGINDDAKYLLNSGVICYKANTNSAALLMSYLGFLVIMKGRIMEAKKPPLFEQGNWDKILREIQNEDKWEASLIDALKQKSVYNRAGLKLRDAVFTCNDSVTVRAQIVYWKDRRNDCVHNKDNEITNAHVETFWSFLESNLQKITVPGGMATLINDFDKFFDIAYTPANSDVSPLIGQIKSSVEKSELPEFWKALFPAANNLIDWENEVKVIEAIFMLGDSVIDKSLYIYLKSNQQLMMAYIEYKPSVIQQLGFTAQEIRNLWKTKLRRFGNPLKVYSSMLRSQLIPDEQINEANKHFAKFLKYTDDIGDHTTLLEFGFGDELHQLLFVERNPNDWKYWKFLNENYKVVRDYIEFFPLKDDVIQILFKQYNSSYHSYFLKSELEELFTNDSKKKHEFIDGLTRLGLSMPYHLDVNQKTVE